MTGLAVCAWSMYCMILSYSCSDYRPVYYSFLSFFRIVKSEMSHVAEKVLGFFLLAEVVIYLKDIPQLNSWCFEY